MTKSMLNEISFLDDTYIEKKKSNDKKETKIFYTSELEREKTYQNC